MREIIFRGKRIDNGEWIVGSYIHLNVNADFICHGRSFNSLIPIKIEVIPETVGQYTGLTDKNGTKIFEGDIVKVEGKLYEIKYMLGQFFVGINMPIAYKRFDCEVIGNIHDNPELIKEV